MTFDQALRIAPTSIPVEPLSRCDFSICRSHDWTVSWPSRSAIILNASFSEGSIRKHTSSVRRRLLEPLLLLTNVTPHREHLHANRLYY